MFDITFIGHMCFDEIIPHQGETRIAPGSAVLCGAMAAARSGKKVAVVTKMAQSDEHILDAMSDVGIKVFLIPSKTTSYMKVIHPSSNVDEREMIQMKNAGYFSIEEIPDFQSKYVHLAGITDQEFSRQFIDDMKNAGYTLTADIQSFVRQVDSTTGRISFKNITNTQDLLKKFEMVKLDIVESEILTGTSDIKKAAEILGTWGSKETIITESKGVLARVDNATYMEKFTNRTNIGRTGRGDTTFAGYLSWRLNHNVAESLKFASAIVSLKMEKPGPFSGTLKDVLNRMEEANISNK